MSIAMNPCRKETIFAVDGRIERLLPDSSGLVIAPEKLFYRDRNYQLDAKYEVTKIRPKNAEIMIDGEATPLGDLALSVGDTLRIHAESGHPSLHELKPFLATESFTNWFKNSFPDIIPVDKVTLKIEQTPLPQRIFRWLLTALAIAAITALLLASLDVCITRPAPNRPTKKRDVLALSSGFCSRSTSSVFSESP
ncbi:MAG: hypothetical protein R3C26_26655 [Calditrichia bacterium]